MRNLIFTSLLFSWSTFATEPSPIEPELQKLEDQCFADFSKIGKAGADKSSMDSALCSKVQRVKDCESQNGIPIYHFNRPGTAKNSRRILAISLIHGDEGPSAEVTRAWMERLEKIEPRNSWRIIPVANPDGFRLNQRMNARGVDLNRNFPTKEWNESALASWKKITKSDPRRYPGPESGSERETKCFLSHFEDFKPDFIISIHTPIGVLDFDGPQVKAPPSPPLPWSPLGNFPGSLGRYMWKDNNIPVLTIELKGNRGIAKLQELDRLQDISGSLAIAAKTKSQK